MIREFAIRIMDAHGKEREFGPIDLEIPETQLVGWEAVAADEMEATKSARKELTAHYVPYCP